MTDNIFNWFLYGKRYYDNNIHDYALEVPHSTKFYEVSTGTTYVVPIPKKKDQKKDQSKDKKVRLTICDNHGRFNSKEFDGCVILGNTCDDQLTPICTDISFLFRRNVLEKTSQPNGCGLISYAKRRYFCLKDKFPNFPSPSEIDEMIEKLGCKKVCKYLYELSFRNEP